jgi:chromosome segregation ATPase
MVSIATNYYQNTGQNPYLQELGNSNPTIAPVQSVQAGVSNLFSNDAQTRYEQNNSQLYNSTNSAANSQTLFETEKVNNGNITNNLNMTSSQIGNYNSQLGNLSSTMDSLLNNIGSIDQMLSDTDSSIQNIQQQYGADIKYYETNQNLTQQQGSLEQNITSFLGMLGLCKTDEEKANVQNKISEAKTNLTNVTKNLLNFSDTNILNKGAAAQENVTKLQDKKTALEERKNTFKAQYMATKAKYNQSAVENSSLQANLDSLQAEYDKLNSSKSQSDQKVDSANTRVIMNNAQVDLDKQKTNESKKELTALTQGVTKDETGNRKSNIGFTAIG